MAFDTTTRKRLSDFVADARRLLTEEFAEQLQSLYGVSLSGDIAPLERLIQLDAEGLELAATLRQRIAYLTSSSPEARDATKAAVDRLTREQAFTVLNRLAAIRMAEKRGLIVESVGQQYQSKGFKVFESVAGSAIGETYDRYRCYLFCLFDELAIDLGALFDRRSPQALLFPREKSLLALLGLLDEADLQDLWAEDETIGWIYQYYNDPAERKKMREESAAPRNSRELAVRNQFFTPRYVVEFLTDNTLGRIWYEMTQGGTTLKEQCRYLVRRPMEIFLKPGESPADQPKQDGLSQEDLLKQPVFIPHRPLKDPRSILMLDPACGSMHFGLYAFDLFEAVYDEAWDIATGSDEAAKSSEGFSPFCAFAASFADKPAFQREVPRMIVEHNLHGIDIDPRAAQIAGLSLWLRAQRAWNAVGVKPVDRPRITRSNIVCAEPMPGDKVILAEFVEQQFPEGERSAFRFLLETVFDRMTLAGEAGSLLKIEEEIRTAIAEAKKLWQKEPQQTQRMLFAGGEDKPADTQKTLDLSGITDEQFWEGAEDRIYAALRAYAEQAEAGGFQRRLFAEDAARGFAFIDVCRKRYDVVVMNPPFGAEPLLTAPIIQKFWKVGEHDLATAFVVQSFSRLQANGSLGVIMTRTPFFLSRFSNWRNEYLLHAQRPLRLFADLGQGVLDSAMVEAVAAVFATAGQHLEAFDCRALGGNEATPSEFANERAFRFDLSLLRNVPNQPLAYNAPPTTLAKFSELGLYRNKGEVKQGLATKDNNRFVRLWWEVAAEETRLNTRWRPYAKGGEYARFFLPLSLVVDWSDAAQAVYKMRDGQMVVLLTAKRDQYLHRPGITYSKRSQLGFSARAMPSETVFSPNGPGVFPKSDSMLYFDLAFLNSSFSRACLEFLTSFGSYSEGYVESLAYTEPDLHAILPVEKSSRECVETARGLLKHDETNKDFSGFCFVGNPTLKEVDQRLQAARSASIEKLNKLFNDVDERIAAALGLNEQDVAFAKHTAFSTALFADEDEASGEPSGSVSHDLLSLLFGVAFGRWDIQYATGDQDAPDLPDPFAPLPVCPAGQLQNTQGLPASPEDVPASYPVKNIPWDGILVDDPNHPLDIECRVREVIEIIWNGKSGGPTAEGIELEACAILGVKSFRDYFRKPANFFADHLKRYSKSRRQAPIYWPISTKSGSYTLWIYYHRLNDQTLHKCLADFLAPKIKDVENELGKLAGKASGRAADLRDFLNELKDLKDEIERVIKLPWKPNLNDGVLITACPLWKLFRLSKWQKDLKACWEELEKGDYDWAHLAYTIWPERVEKVCEKDRSIAIAHGLEHLCKVEAPKPKKPRGKKASS